MLRGLSKYGESFLSPYNTFARIPLKVLVVYKCAIKEQNKQNKKR